MIDLDMPVDADAVQVHLAAEAGAEELHRATARADRSPGSAGATSSSPVP